MLPCDVTRGALFVFTCAAFTSLAIAAELEEQQSWQRSLSLDQAERLTVDLLFGSIEVTPASGGEVQLSVVETVTARTDQALQRARRDTALREQRKGNEILLFADGPFRDHPGRHGWRGGDWNPGYEVRYDLRLEVPESIDLHLETVDGDVVVRHIEGRLELGAVNGGVRVEGAVAPVEASAVNGPVEVTFARPPESDCHLETVNGEITATFPASLAAELRFRTMNGEVWSAFEGPPVGRGPVAVEVQGAKRILRLDPTFGIRVARGGSRHLFESLNGDIHVRATPKR